jgi:hypothetical protein
MNKHLCSDSASGFFSTAAQSIYSPTNHRRGIVEVMSTTTGNSFDTEGTLLNHLRD